MDFAEDSMKQDAKNGSADNQGKQEKGLAYYFNMKNPATGRRYDIPMLNTMDPAYVFKYVEMMKTKEEQPDLFERMLRWD